MLPHRHSDDVGSCCDQARGGDRTARIAWTRPAAGASSVDSFVIASELWGPSIHAWHPPTYRTVSANQFATNFRGLDNGRTYRFRVLAHNRAGNSAWTPYAKVTPAAAPLAPATDRQLVSGREYVRFGWWNGMNRGAPVTSYTAGIRRWTGRAWTPWRFVDTAGSVRTYRWNGLAPGTRYQVTVRANSSVGSSPWGKLRTVVTTR